MILETVLAFIKTLPSWLMNVCDILIVAVLFLTSMTFLAGIWCGIKVIGKRANSIKEISLLPPRIIFVNNEKENK
jgi:hypothetical protein